MKKVFFLLTLLCFAYSCHYDSKKSQKFYMKQEYKGVIINKYQDWHDHGREYFTILNQNKDTVDLSPAEWRKDQIWDYVKVGDSIIKPLNVLDITVKRKNDPPRKFRYQDIGITL